MADHPHVIRRNLVVADANTSANTTTMNVSIYVVGTDAIRLPQGNTLQRVTASNGYIRYNSETAQFEGVFNGTWGNIGIKVYDTANAQIYP